MAAHKLLITWEESQELLETLVKPLEIAIMVARSVARPYLNIPPSSTTVSVKILDLCTISNFPANKLYAPPITGIECLDPVPSFSFLIEHPSGQKILFDLGLPKDLASLGQTVVDRLKTLPVKIFVEKDVTEALEENGIKSSRINAVIWSHAQWDHKGNMATFPPSTDLVLGPGTKQAFLEGESNSMIGGIQPGDIAGGRTVREISFNGPSALQIGQFRAIDYFSDGSLYLLDTPGHCIGHLCALARTTADTFIFMAGDAAHHCAEYRPSKYVPLPSSITPNPVDMKQRHVPYCLGSLFEDLNVQRDRDPIGPLYQPVSGHNMGEILETIRGMQEYDGDENVLVILAHDSSFRGSSAPFFPKEINDWKARRLGSDLGWQWIGDILRALKRPQ